METAEGENLGSCWGFFGLDDVKTQATAAAKSEAKAIAEREAGVEKLINTGYALW